MHQKGLLLLDSSDHGASKMTFPKARLLFASALFFPMAPLSGWAQAPASESDMVACPSQLELEQSIESEGAILPDECTRLQVNALSSESGVLCLIDFGLDEGFLGQLRDAAFPSQWWVECDKLARSAAGSPDNPR